MAASHTKLKLLNFPLVFQNRGGCRLSSLAQSAPGSVKEPPIEQGPEFVVHTEVEKKIRLQIWMFAQMELMRKTHSD